MVKKGSGFSAFQEGCKFAPPVLHVVTYSRWQGATRLFRARRCVCSMNMAERATKLACSVVSRLSSVCW